MAAITKTFQQKTEGHTWLAFRLWAELIRIHLDLRPAMKRNHLLLYFGGFIKWQSGFHAPDVFDWRLRKFLQWLLCGRNHFCWVCRLRVLESGELERNKRYCCTDFMIASKIPSWSVFPFGHFISLLIVLFVLGHLLNSVLDKLNLRTQCYILNRTEVMWKISICQYPASYWWYHESYLLNTTRIVQKF